MDQQSAAKNIIERIEELSTFTEDEHGVSRFFGTKTFIECSKKICGWMKNAGLKTRIDNIGNVRGKLLSDDPQAKTLVIASHIDTEEKAGKFEGPLGILIALELINSLHEQNVKLPFHIEVIAFSAEKGARFHSKYVAGKVITGTFDKSLLDLKDDDGIKLSEVLTLMDSDIQKLEADQISEDNWLAYFEIDIEGGPVLYQKAIPVGIVKSIAGQKVIRLEFSGQTGDAGSFPMNMRYDALSGAAEFIGEVEEYASKEKRSLIATVTEIHIPEASANMIPAKVVCTLDLRSSNNELLSEAYQNINYLCEDICHKRNIYFEWKLMSETDAVDCDPGLKKILSDAIKSQDIEIAELISGTGHTAGIISQVAPVAILFVKCYKGISHNPLENVEINDIETALEVAETFVMKLKDQVTTLNSRR